MLFKFLAEYRDTDAPTQFLPRYSPLNLTSHEHIHWKSSEMRCTPSSTFISQFYPLSTNFYLCRYTQYLSLSYVANSEYHSEKVWHPTLNLMYLLIYSIDLQVKIHGPINNALFPLLSRQLSNVSRVLMLVIFCCQPKSEIERFVRVAVVYPALFFLCIYLYNFI